MMKMTNTNNNDCAQPVDPYVCGGPLETRLEARLRVAVDSGAVCAVRRRYKQKQQPQSNEPGAVTRTRGRLAAAVAAGRLAVHRAAARPAAGVTLRRRGGEAWTVAGAELDLQADLLQDDDDCWC